MPYHRTGAFNGHPTGVERGKAVLSLDGNPRHERQWLDFPRPGRPPWRRPWVRAIVYQGLALSALGALAAFVISNNREYLPRAVLELGWDFLRYPARFDIDDNLIGASGRDPVWMAFLAGTLNTIAVSLVSIVMCTALAITVALARLSSNWLLSRTALIYIETVRNVPLLLQLLFWYSLSTQFPLPRNAWQPLPGVFVTNRGVFFPVLQATLIHYIALAVFILGLAATFALGVRSYRRRARTGSASREYYTPLHSQAPLPWPSSFWVARHCASMRWFSRASILSAAARSAPNSSRWRLALPCTNRPSRPRPYAAASSAFGRARSKPHAASA